MHELEEEDGGPLRGIPAGAPPLRLAGVDEEDHGELHIVRGID
ncbi:hypothetical protein [Streptomyces sp. NPDC085529]